MNIIASSERRYITVIGPPKILKEILKDSGAAFRRDEYLKLRMEYSAGGWHIM